jgi:hypothetical protein
VNKINYDKTLNIPWCKTAIKIFAICLLFWGITGCGFIQLSFIVGDFISDIWDHNFGLVTLGAYCLVCMILNFIGILISPLFGIFAQKNKQQKGVYNVSVRVSLVGFGVIYLLWPLYCLYADFYSFNSVLFILAMINFWLSEYFYLRKIKLFL